jgi:hypothetical protein
MERIRRGQGKIEYFVVRDEVFDLVQNHGYNLMLVWEKLTQEKKLTIPYRTFVTYANKVLKPGTSSSQKTTSTNDPVPGGKSTEFQHSSVPDTGKLF